MKAKPAKYPLTQDDLAEIGRRMAKGETCTIPVRNDVKLTDGTRCENVLCWGSPKAYVLYQEDGQTYSKYRWGGE